MSYRLNGQLKLTLAEVAEAIGAPVVATIPVTTGVLCPTRWVGWAPPSGGGQRRVIFRPLLLTFEGTPRQGDTAFARLTAYNQLFAHAKYERSGVSWWPWRMPPTNHSIPSTPDAGELDYSKFAYVVSAEALATDSWLADVLAAATDGRWKLMRAALDEAAPLFAYARSSCGGGREVCDAFSALQDVVF
ncbi:hypothetical protein T492DRAFT_840952 [Pavlovales sp. CCMP2436]|nr:hypothetical protein T492DRAFT_840952 [Pavlovales sp. CCMP2436]